MALEEAYNNTNDFPAPMSTLDEQILAADKTYVGGRLKSTGGPWLRPFRRHSGISEFSAGKRSELWPEKPVETILRDTPDEGSSIPPKTSPEAEELLGVPDDSPPSYPNVEEPQKWIPEWSNGEFYTFRKLLNIPEDWKSEKIVLIWRGPERQDLRIFTDSVESANSVVTVLTGGYELPLSHLRVNLQIITREQYDKAEG